MTSSWSGSLPVRLGASYSASSQSGGTPTEKQAGTLASTSPVQHPEQEAGTVASANLILQQEDSEIRVLEAISFRPGATLNLARGELRKTLSMLSH